MMRKRMRWAGPCPDNGIEVVQQLAGEVEVDLTGSNRQPQVG
jgi:hypothetical protein